MGGHAFVAIAHAQGGRVLSQTGFPATKCECQPSWPSKKAWYTMPCRDVALPTQIAPVIMKSPVNLVPAPPPFPVDALPETTRQVVGAIQRGTGAPVSTIASALLCAMATAAQFKVRIEHAKGSRHVSCPSLFMINIDDCGAAKSEAFRLAFEGLYRYQQIQDARKKALYSKAEEEHKTVCKMLEAPEIEATKRNQIIQAREATSAELKRLKHALGPSSGFIQSRAESISLRNIATQSGWRAAIVNADADSALEAKSLKALDRLGPGWDSQDQRELSGVEKMTTASKDRCMDPGLYRYAPHVSVCLAMRSAALQQFIDQKQSISHVGSFMERCLFSLAGDFKGKPIILDEKLDYLADFQRKALNLANRGLPVDVHHGYDTTFERRGVVEHYRRIFPSYANLPGFDTYISYQYENTMRVAALLQIIEEKNSSFDNIHIDPELYVSAMALVEWHIQVYAFVFLGERAQRQTLEDAKELRGKLQTIIKRRLQRGEVPMPSQQMPIWSIARNEVYQQRPDRKMGTERFAKALKLLSSQGLLTENLSPTKKRWLQVYTDQLGNLGAGG